MSHARSRVIIGRLKRYFYFAVRPPSPDLALLKFADFIGVCELRKAARFSGFVSEFAVRNPEAVSVKALFYRAFRKSACKASAAAPPQKQASM